MPPPKLIFYYYRISIKEGIETDTYRPYLGANIDFEISKMCQQCCVQF